MNNLKYIDHVEYCTKCGKKLIPQNKPFKYCNKTGNPLFYFECPTNLCGHSGLDHNYIWMDKKQNIINKLKDTFVGRYYIKCTRCGHIETQYEMPGL